MILRGLSKGIVSEEDYLEKYTELYSKEELKLLQVVD
jgi:hypothetical protein